MKITLLTGGARSGKSSFAIEYAQSIQGRRLFVATAPAIDPEMDLRIVNHSKEREGLFETVEEQFSIDTVIESHLTTHPVIVLDCYATWLGNLYYKTGDNETSVKELVDKWIEYLSKDSSSNELVIVTNEVGWGIVPEDALSRSYRDMLGYLNKRTATLAQKVYLSVCGIQIPIKS